jgi:ABC-type phosphate transport system substrate-binding protein
VITAHVKLGANVSVTRSRREGAGETADSDARDKRGMRKLTKILTGVATVAAALALAVPAANADPINGKSQPVVPTYYDIVGVGSNTTQYVVDQIAFNYDASGDHSTTHPYIYSWDATNPYTGATGDTIATKADCNTKALEIARPNGSGAGLTALDDNTKNSKGYYCVDYARSSSGRSSTSPKFGPGGVVYVPFAKDAVTWATDKTTNAPASLTLTQLYDIYTCKVTNWDKLGGKNAEIQPYLPPTSSGTRSFFLKEIGVTSVSTGCVPASHQTVEENEGINSVFKNNPNILVPYSIGSWLSQEYRSAAIGKNPTSGQNKFGHDENGYLYLNEVNGTAPYVKSGTAKSPDYVINSSFSKSGTTYPLIRVLYNIVRYYGTSANYYMAPREEEFFAPKGYLCSTAAQTQIKNYGFLVDALCGHGD